MSGGQIIEKIYSDLKHKSIYYEPLKQGWICDFKLPEVVETIYNDGNTNLERYSIKEENDIISYFMRFNYE